MVVDQASRNKLQEMQTAKTISDGINKLSETLKGGTGSGGEMVLANEFRALQKVLNQEALDKLKAIISSLDEKVGALSEIEKNLPRKVELNFPANYPVTGSVSIDNPVNIGNPNAIAKELAPLISNLTVTMQRAVAGIRVATPSAMSIKDSVEIQDFKTLLDDMEELKKGLNLLVNKETATVSFPTTAVPVEITNQFIPQPVTNININPLQGFVKTTAATVGTLAVSLPNYGQLFNRRSVVVYNNSANTIYIGGSDVTTSNGVPVPASSYSPILDAGYNMKVYGIAAQGGNDVRVLEVSKDKEADVQG